MNILVATLLAAAPAANATPIATPVQNVVRHAADAKGIAAAERLMKATGYDRLMADTVETLITGQRAAIAENIRQKMGDDADEEMMAKLGTFLGGEIRSMFRENDQQLRTAYATLYASYFTADELDRLAIMQADPLMQKSVKIMPSMLNEIMTLMQGINGRREAAMRERMMKLIEEHLATSKG